MHTQPRRSAGGGGDRANGVVLLQGHGGELPSAVFPRWTLQPHSATLSLSGCQTLSPPVIAALSLLDLVDATAPLPATAAPPGHPPQEGVLEGLLGGLSEAYRGEAAALDVARAAAADALVCCNAWFATGPQAEVTVQQMWRAEDVEGYVRQCWEARERCRRREFALDVSWLVEEGYVTWDEIPTGVRALQNPGRGGAFTGRRGNWGATSGSAGWGSEDEGIR